jgi:predicted nucleic acid-binding protein
LESHRSVSDKRCQYDPKDEPYINLAIAAEAGYLVSRDSDILDLADASSPDGGRLRLQAAHLQVLDPVSFLLEARHRPSNPI